MLKHLNPKTVVPPFSRYSQAVEVPAGARWLHVSGQVGVKPDGAMEQGFAAQARRTWSNLIACLSAAGMTAGDLVKVTVYLTRTEDIAASRAIRDEALGGAEPASTLVVVAGLAGPEWQIEVEGVAAKE